MSKFYSHLQTAAQLVQKYQGGQPFGFFLKSFFREHKKYGSRDRKNIGQLCYSCFRLGHSLNEIPLEEKIKAGLFLCTEEKTELLEFFFPQWDPSASLEQRIASIAGRWPSFHIDDIFPWYGSLSPAIDPSSFILSHLRQPDLFLRVRPGYHQRVAAALKEAGPFEFVGADTVRLPNGFQAQHFFEINREVVIQDYNSQRVGALMVDGAAQFRKARVWDCCAASGGKSIMAFDLLPGIELTVSDRRASIMQQLKQRFSDAGIREYSSFVSDLSGAVDDIPVSHADLIIADVPCTGSGTWSRTPEQLCFFDKASIATYQRLQKSIVKNVARYLQPDGRLLYITCSVFREENEEVVQFIEESCGLRLLQMTALKGYDKKADTLFAALFSTK